LGRYDAGFTRTASDFTVHMARALYVVVKS